MTERRIFAYVVTSPAKHSKEARAQTFIGRAAVKGLSLPHAASWLSDFVAELISFPSSAHDDMVDSCSVLFQSLANITPGRVPTPPKLRKLLSTDPALCNISLTELFEANERRHQKSGRI